jgi:hypothetical protein
MEFPMLDGDIDPFRFKKTLLGRDLYSQESGVEPHVVMKERESEILADFFEVVS